jgi:hypothetical protein
MFLPLPVMITINQTVYALFNVPNYIKGLLWLRNAFIFYFWKAFHFYLFGSSDQTNNGSEISDPDVLICKYRK